MPLTFVQFVECRLLTLLGLRSFWCSSLAFIASNDFKQVVAADVDIVVKSLFVVVYCLSNALAWSIICQEISSIFSLSSWRCLSILRRISWKWLQHSIGQFWFCSECELIIKTKEFPERFRQFSFDTLLLFAQIHFVVEKLFWANLFTPYSLPFLFWILVYSRHHSILFCLRTVSSLLRCWVHKCCHCTGSIWRDLWISYCSMSMCSRILSSIFVSFLILNNF